MILRSEVRERELYYVEGTEEVCLELVAQVVVVLVLTGSDYTCIDNELPSLLMLELYTIAGAAVHETSQFQIHNGECREGILANDIDISPVLDASLYHIVYSFSDPYVA